MVVVHSCTMMLSNKMLHCHFVTTLTCKAKLGVVFKFIVSTFKFLSDGSELSIIIVIVTFVFIIIIIVVGTVTCSIQISCNIEKFSVLLLKLLSNIQTVQN